jgi:hypothetical protein
MRLKNFLLYLIYQADTRADELRRHDPSCSVLNIELLQFYYSQNPPHGLAASRPGSSRSGTNQFTFSL